MPGEGTDDYKFARLIISSKTEAEHLHMCRKENELAVLIQYIDRKKMEPPAATFLDIILYSREQIRKENQSTGDATADTEAPWGIISVKVLENHYNTAPQAPFLLMKRVLFLSTGSVVRLRASNATNNYYEKRAWDGGRRKWSSSGQREVQREHNILDGKCVYKIGILYLPNTYDTSQFI